ncbi:MAG: hemin-degrading factor [Nitratireductor sp.]|nr:hemin-degrading factor [Nitratireductor sp.]
MSSGQDAAAIRQARQENPKMRARDLAQKLGISEAEYVAAWCGDETRRIKVDFNRIFTGLADAGEVMALTRNESAVHEKIGIYDNFIAGKHAAMMLGELIDMRMFPAKWVHGFAVTSRDGDTVRHSLQFFDAQGDAIHKVHARPATNLEAWQKLVDELVADDQSPAVEIEASKHTDTEGDAEVPVSQLRERWSRMTDTHQFVSILKKLNLSRLAAVSSVGEDFAWRIDNSGVEAMMRLSASEALPIMCFVGNPGCIQIHSGPIGNIVPMGPWLNVMDSSFHLHLRLDHITEAWVVRKPTDKGHVTSLEAYDRDGNLIIQFFGKRVEGQDERPGWRVIMENLPRARKTEAA